MSHDVRGPGFAGAQPMSSAAAVGPALAPAAWLPPLLLFSLGLLVLAIAFFQEGAAAVRVWDNSATYNHCWLILPIVGWLAWSRRYRLANLRPEPSALLALLALPPAVAWLAAERLGIMEGRQLAVIGLIWSLALAILGWRVCRAMAAPLLYLVFLVPFGAFTTPFLQTITARMIDLGLDLTGIPHYVDDLIIETPAGTFLVAEACAGLRFLIAAIAFGALYAFTMFRSPGRRLIVMLLAVTVPIIANGLRAFGIVVLGSYLGSAEAAAVDHVLYGWVFFSAVILLLIAAGLPFRQDGAPQQPEMPSAPAVPAPPRGGVALAAAALLAIGFAAAGPALSYTLRQTAAVAPERRVVSLEPFDTCVTDTASLTLRCGAVTVHAEATILPAQVTWSAVSAERGRIAGSNDQDQLFSVGVAGSNAWSVRQSSDRGTTIALATWLNGRPTGGGVRSRAQQAWNSLGGGEGVPVVVAVTLRASDVGEFDRLQQRSMLQTLLQAQGRELAALAAAASRAR